jgi:predicted metal-binding protein
VPTYVGSLDEIRAKLREFRRGLLLQYSKNIDVHGDRKGVRLIKIDFHKKILQLEEFLRNSELPHVWGMIGGNCEECDVCKIKNSEPCAYPEKARSSMEANGIDVLDLLAKLGLDNDFHKDKITWTGCLLF